MASPEALAHLLVGGRAEDRTFQRPGRGDPKIRDVERRSHGAAMRVQATSSLNAGSAQRGSLPTTLQELKAIGVVVVLEGADATYPLKLESLDSMSRHRKVPSVPRWQLLSVMPATDTAPERATIWVSDAYRAAFLKIFEDYLTRESPAGNAWGAPLVANIGRIRTAVLEDLWQSADPPPTEGTHWWELWLTPTDSALQDLRAFAEKTGLEVATRALLLNERTVVWVHCAWTGLTALPFTRVPVTEIRRPELVEAIDTFTPEERNELTEDLAGRIAHTNRFAPAVCHLDTGVRASHQLLAGSLAPEDIHTIVGSTADQQNHGTPMAGLALYGPLEELLLGTRQVRLTHRLESVKFLPDVGGHDPLVYGLVTAQAVSLPEATTTRQRVFCMPITAPPDAAPGEPSLWSASIDALAMGTGIAADANGIALLGSPEPDAARLFLISVGNVEHHELRANYHDVCDAACAEDPSQAWNALAVGAYTELVGTPADQSFVGWAALARSGDVSPHSRTSLMFSHRKWPIKPDICMEGGNVLHNGASDFVGDHPVLSLATTDAEHDLAIGTATATSAATAQAARLAAMAFARYPAFWPESVRGLLVHAAEWTPSMRRNINAANTKTARLAMLRRYGWGVPSEDAVLSSRRQAVTMVTQDSFVPFEGEDFLSRSFRLHRLPWPKEVLRQLGAGRVDLRVTLSYFVEPTMSRRGWRRRYAYPSHGLRFDLKGPQESLDEFIARVNMQARDEEDEAPRPGSPSERWMVGAKQRTLGSLHQDIWEGEGADLAECGVLAVYPVGGWWKNQKTLDLRDQPLRYSLLTSLKTEAQSVDLYTPIAVQLQLPITVA